MTQEFKIGSKVKHKVHGFEGVVERKANGYVELVITKGSHPYKNGQTTYNADTSNLILQQEIEIGSYVLHTRYGFKGTVETLNQGNARVRIAEGVHPFASGKTTYEAMPSSLRLIEAPKDIMDKLVKEHKTKEEESKSKVRELEMKLLELQDKAKVLADENYEMEVELEGMTVKTDFATFKKMITFMMTFGKK